MSRLRKCKHNTIHFRFDMPVNPDGVFCGNLTVEGYGCMEGHKYSADIDSVEYEGAEIKPVLELHGGMKLIDAAAEHHVEGLFQLNQLQVA